MTRTLGRSSGRWMHNYMAYFKCDVMKMMFVILVMAMAATVNGQSLKDALYGGKLKADTGTLVKKGDTLALKENMARKQADDSVRKAAVQAAIPATNPAAPDSSTGNQPVAPVAVTPETQAPAAPDPVKENARIWKQFVDEYTVIIKSEVMPSKKIKNGTYSILIDYEIGTDGNVSTVNVFCTPQSSYLVEQVKVRMMANAPQLHPLLLSNGKPRKALKKQTLTFVKEKD